MDQIFGQFTLQPHRQLLAAGQPVHIGGKALDVLSVLVAADGGLVTKDELIEAVWKGLIVEDNALQAQISQLRKLLGSEAGRLVAVHGRGYRLDLNSPGLTPAEPETPLVAVLAFDDMSDGGNMQVFCDGVSEEVISRLARGSQLRVIGRTSSFQFRSEQKAVAAEALGASHIVEGAIRRSGNRVRISIHLVEARSQTTLWSERYDEPIDDILAVQDRIAERVAIALDDAFATPPLPAIDPTIYDLYLQAKSRMINIRTYADVIPLLERVTAVAPAFAPAWAALANARAFTGNFATLSERKPIFASTKTAIANCLAADPGSTETIGPEFWVLPAFGEYEAQHKIMKRAMALGKNKPDLQFIVAQHHVNTGRIREAAKHALVARQLDPGSVYNSSIYGRCLYYSGDLNEAREVLNIDVQKFPHNYVVAGTLSVCAALLGDRDTVDRLSSPERMRLLPFHELSPLIDIARVILDPAPAARARLVESIVEKALSAGSIDIIWLVAVAKFGSIDAAYRLTESCRLGPGGDPGEKLSPGGYRTQHLFQRPWDELRRDRRFATLCARFGLAQHWIETDSWPDCAVEEDFGYDFRAECAHAAKTVPLESYYP